MAKKPIFTSSPDSFKETRLAEIDASVYTHTHDDTHTHTHARVQENTHRQAGVEPAGRAKKTRRIQILTFDSLVDRVDAYAKKRNVSRAEVFEVAMEKFLSELGE